MANKPTTGRVGVAPSRERCPICEHHAVLMPNVDGERMCPPCCDRYAQLMDDQDAALEREVLGDRAGQPAVDTVPDALLPWLHIVTDYALRQ